MSKAVKSLGWLLAVTAAAFLCLFLIDGYILKDRKVIQADMGAGGWNETVSNDMYMDDEFTIIEIVPYKGLSVFRYLVGGEEGIDSSLLPTNLGTTRGEFSTLEDAISFFNAYVEKELPASGKADNGWYKGRRVEYQNGYFEWVGWNNGGSYAETGSASYVYAGDGQGDYIALPDKDNSKYNSFDHNNPPENRRNVKAYFVAGQPAGVELYSTSLKYRVLYVNKNPGKGDYNYDLESKTFVLAKGQGDYDIIFEQSTASDAIYYILKDGFELVFDRSGTYSWSLKYEYVGNNKGNFKKIDFGFKYQSGGPFKWVQDDSVTDAPKITRDPKEDWHIQRAYIRGQEISVDAYQYSLSVTMINNEWFKRNVLRIPADQVSNYKVRVITMTPEELNALGNTDIIKRADLFYLSEDLQNQDYVKWYRKYNPEGKKDIDYNKNKHVFKNNDLNWECTETIFKRVAGVYGKRIGIIISTSVFSGTKSKNLSYSLYKDMDKFINDMTTDTHSTICNVGKLYLMLMQRDIVGFYNAFMNPDTNSPYKISSVPVSKSINPSGTTGSFVRPDQIDNGLSEQQFKSRYEAARTEDVAIYWNYITFIPYEYKAESNSLGIIEGSRNEALKLNFPHMNFLKNTRELHENVLTMDGSEYFNHVLHKKYLETAARDFSKVLTYANALNGISRSYVIMNDAVNYIINAPLPLPGGIKPLPDEDDHSARDYISVLNIQPTADFEASNAKIKEIFDQMPIKIEEMTTTQFNASISDINSNYDVIYMGAGVSRFNLDSGKRTIFNDSTMSNKHYIFFEDGDFIDTYEGSKRYYGNDLSPDAVQAIKEHAKAGFLLLLENELYSLQEIVNPASNVYRLINEVKNNQLLYSYVLNVKDFDLNNTSRLAFMANVLKSVSIPRPRIVMQTPVVSEDAKAYYHYPENGIISFKFRLEPWGLLPSPYRYNAYLYLDLNSDGIFDENERLDRIEGTGVSHLNGISESWTRIYTVNLDLKKEALDLNGAYQWKIKLVRSDKPEIRGEATGYAAFSKSEIIKVLQIIDNPRAGRTNYRLSSKANDPASLMSSIGRLEGLQAGSYYNIEYTTMTVAEYEALFKEGDAYTTETRISTNRLSAYHVLILDNRLDDISDENGALQNIKDEIGSGMGVIFTKDAINYEKQLDYLSASSFLFRNRYTYNKINRIAKPGQLYIYSNLAANGRLDSDLSYISNHLTRANRGIITEYPYRIGKKLAVSESSYSVNLTLSNNKPNSSVTPLVGWYSLSDNKSPLVNSSVYKTDKYTGIYSSSPNDIYNNYYMINRGNVFCSGIVFEKADNSLYENELKLFVNTLFAAYQMGKRKPSTPAKITFISPEPVNEDGINKITLSDEYIRDGELILIFEISDSSSDVDLTILLDGKKPDGEFADKIYKVVDGSIGEAIKISDNEKKVKNGRYAIKIPLSALTDEEGRLTDRLLTVKAVNKEELATTVNLLIVGAQPVVEFIEPKPIMNAGKAYLYVDIDFYGLDTSEYGLDHAEEIRLVFRVDKASSFSLGAFLGDEDLLDEDGPKAKLYPLAQDRVAEADPKALTQGEYVIYLPASVMKGNSSRGFVIRATSSSGASGEASLTLLRRNLFILD